MPWLGVAVWLSSRGDELVLSASDTYVVPFLILQRKLLTSLSCQSKVHNYRPMSPKDVNGSDSTAALLSPLNLPSRLSLISKRIMYDGLCQWVSRCSAGFGFTEIVNDTDRYHEICLGRWDLDLVQCITVAFFSSMISMVLILTCSSTTSNIHLLRFVCSKLPTH